MIQKIQKQWQKWMLRCIAFVLGVLLTAITPHGAWGAEQLTTYLGPIQLSIPVQSLEVFAKEGKATGTLKLVLSFLGNNFQAPMRKALQTPLPFNAVTISRVSYIPMIEQVIRSVGNTVQTTSGQNGFYGVRAAVLLAASKHPEGWTILDVLREFPGRDLRINLGALLTARRDLTKALASQFAATNLLIQQANQEAQADPQMDYASLPDLGKPGPYPIRKEQLQFQIQAVRPTLEGFSGSYTLKVDLYLPQGAPGSLPTVVYSHGWGGRLTDGQYIAEHLTSHGFGVAVPQHIGTTDLYRAEFLAGTLGDITNPVEYLSRQYDITFLLDELEKMAKTDPDRVGRLNLQKVGVIGQSLGGQTSLAAAGASFDPAQYTGLCARGWLQFNPSFLIQCQSRFLPPKTFRFDDPRIKAAVAQFPMGATMFGPEGVGSIKVPTLTLAAGMDLLAPSVYEQIPMFSWLKAPRYLAYLPAGNHFSTSPPGNISMIPAILRGPDAAIGRGYIQFLSTAFFKTYLGDSPETSSYRPYLTASYARAISQDASKLYLVKSLTPEQLAPVYGGIAPASNRQTAALPASPAETVLKDIRQSGVLRVGITSDAAPFGYINNATGSWGGYCFELANALRGYVSAELDRPFDVEPVYLPSNLQDRFDLVRDRRVHLNCGPNTITTNVPGIAFSDPFFVTGTRFLVSSGNREQINPNGNLSGVTVGVLKNSVTEAFVRQRYPDARIIAIEDNQGSTAAIQAVREGTISAFADDSILLQGELLQAGGSSTVATSGTTANSRSSFALVPELPLTCDYYGLILPANDPQWEELINTFNRSETARRLRNQWFGNLSNDILPTLTYCENRG